ncbi:hypothetical protein FE257_010303 [Aspergillus nanangensis]|uniref:Uncharacterized protein n=1 Tax=Aspergillus nanangensis TaxID=2582783 RepID=A0AAD4GTD0_ASPNN|nr:hypothetical protein FE257_010303 [Aspergillus nanangensis]
MTLALSCGLGAADTLFAERANPGVSYVEGPYVEFQPGYLTGTWLLFHNSDWIRLSGTGYVRLRWEVEYWKRAGITNDLVADVTGTWDMVAGAGFRFGDQPAPFCNDPSAACVNATGGTDYGYTWFTNEANHWNNEYFWLDGEVTLQTAETLGLYNVAVQTSDYATILEDINGLGASYDPDFGACPCYS